MALNLRSTQIKPVKSRLFFVSDVFLDVNKKCLFSLTRTGTFQFEDLPIRVTKIVVQGKFTSFNSLVIFSLKHWITDRSVLDCIHIINTTLNWFILKYVIRMVNVFIPATVIL